MQPIVILGSNGMLGSMLTWYARNRGHEVIAVDRTMFDVQVDTISKLEVYIIGAKCVINCIGAIPQRNYTEAQYYELNATFPQKLATHCLKFNIPLIHVSTNCVFSGSKAFCTESDIPDATDTYGKSKALGEPSTAVVVRCSIIGPELHTKFGLMEWFLANTGEVNGYTDHYWNGLTTLELSKQIFRLIDERRFDCGVYHFYSSNTLSKYEILECISRHVPVEKRCKINPVDVGMKHYTLTSNKIHGAKPIEEQIADIFEIIKYYRNKND